MAEAQDSAAVEACNKQLAALLDDAEAQLGQTPWLAGEAYSMVGRGGPAPVVNVAAGPNRRRTQCRGKAWSARATQLRVAAPRLTPRVLAITTRRLT